MTTETKPAIHLEDWPIKGIPEDVAVLMRVRERLSKPENWCQGTLLETVGGDVRACLLGSIALESGWDGRDGDFDASLESARLAEKRLGYDLHTGVVIFNDSHSHAEVLALLDMAIKEGLAE